MRKDISELSNSELKKLLRKESPELVVMLPDLQKRLKELSTVMKPMVDSAHSDPPSLPDGQPLSETGQRLVDCEAQIQLNYCMMLVNYMLLKAERRDVREHPLMPLLVKSRSK